MNGALKGYKGFKEPEGKLHKGRIDIGEPYIKEMENGKTRLCADVKVNDEPQTLYFEVDDCWAKYLVTEVSDSFVLGIIERAMKNSWDISFAAPMSEDLYYSLTTYMIPVYARNFNMFHEIDLNGETTNDIPQSEKRAGTGFSAGVDSFYSVLKHMGNEKCPEHNVTPLLLALNGAASTGVSEKIDAEWLENSRNKFKPYADKLGLGLVCVGGNIDLFYVGDRCINGETITTAAFVYALQKLFGIYYWASAYQAEIFYLGNESAGGFAEDIAVPYVSTRAISFYHSGSETNRIGKERFISDNTVAQQGLTVCGELNAKNCGRCGKCIRTMAELNAIGKLDEFKDAFPVDEYRRHFVRRLAEELAVDHKPFTTDILVSMRENHVRIPLMSRVLSVIYYRPVNFMEQRLKNKLWARKLYYKFDLDEKWKGRKHTEEERERFLNGQGKN